MIVVSGHFVLKQFIIQLKSTDMVFFKIMLLSQNEIIRSRGKNTKDSLAVTCSDNTFW
jgi:hypothetical protein